MSTRSCAVRITSFSTGSKIQPTGFKVYIPTRFYTSCPSLCTLATFSTQLHCTQLHCTQLHCTQLHCTQTLPVAVQKLYTKPHPIKCTIYACMIYVAVSGRNWTLFRCIFQSQYCVQSAVTQHFRYGWGSYSLCKLMNTRHVYTACMSPTPNGSSALLNTVMRSKYDVWFLPGTATLCACTFLLQPLLLC